MKNKSTPMIHLWLCCAILVAGIILPSMPQQGEASTTTTAAKTPKKVSTKAKQTKKSKSKAKQTIQKTLWVGTVGHYRKFTVSYAKEPTPDQLIGSIGKLTGWNMRLAEPVITGKQAYTVVFHPKSALYVGPPIKQKDAFHVYDHDSLARIILDSTAQTLRYNAFLKPEKANLNALKIYYAMPGDKPLQLAGTSISLRLDEAYPGSDKLLTN